MSCSHDLEDKVLQLQGMIGELEDFMTTQHKTILKQSDNIVLTLEFFGVIPQCIQLRYAHEDRNIKLMMQPGHSYRTASTPASPNMWANEVDLDHTSPSRE